MRTIAAASLLTAALAAPAFSQSGVYSRAAPPDKATLDRLGLVADWTTYLPVRGTTDGIVAVQPVEDTQIYVQTKSGLLVAVDAKTGREQWRYKFPAAVGDGFAVAVNEKVVFSVNLSKLFCHQRYSGTLEFEVNLPETPAVGPVTDGDQVYIAYTGGKVACYELPPSFQTSMIAKAKSKELKALQAQMKNPADEVYERNATRNFVPPKRDEPTEGFNVPRAYMEGRVESLSAQGTPSVAALQSITPPYILGGLNKVVSVAMLPSVRQPYTLKPDYMTHNQRTPSVAAIPPSLARVYELSNLKPPPFEPKLRWITTTPAKVYHRPLFVPDNARASARLWVTSDSRVVQALPRDQGDGNEEQQWTMAAKPSGQLVGPFGYTKEVLLGVLPLADGQVLGVDLAGGTKENPRYEWRANVGGSLNRTPIAAADGVYVAGDHSGCARINVTTGQVDWRTGSDVDRIAAVTADRVYARDRRGDLFVYAKGRVNDTTNFFARPIGSLPAADFGVNVQNGGTDRLFLAADNGLLVCLRDAGAKNAAIRVIAPPPPPFPPAGEQPPPTDPKQPADPANPDKPKDAKPDNPPKPLDSKPGEPAKPEPPAPPAPPKPPTDPPKDDKKPEPPKPADPPKKDDKSGEEKK